MLKRCCLQSSTGQPNYDSTTITATDFEADLVDDEQSIHTAEDDDADLAQAPHLSFLMETKLKSGSVNRIREALNFSNEIEVPRQENFYSAINYGHLVRLDHDDDIFTWTNKSPDDAHMKECLDYCFANSHWQQVFPYTTLHHLDYSSDHRALKVVVSHQPNYVHSTPKQKSRFKYEILWLNDPECQDIVVCHWTSSTHQNLGQVVTNIQQCSTHLQAWHVKKYGNMRKNISKAQDWVASLHNSNDSRVDFFSELRKSERILDDLSSIFDKIIRNLSLIFHTNK
uniref:Uncharacterized protein n=1 Tax=Cannabis sativa TaxID=3483 RepID=A0A803NIP1_CANSA